MSRHGKAERFGDLILQFTTRFELQWNDKGSGADHDVSFYRPIPPAGFHALGSIGQKGYDDPNGKVAALCVKAAEPTSARPPLARPVRYDFIWSDRGSGADRNGSCWRPVPPAGYVALGDVFVKGYDAPTLDAVMCVARGLTFEGTIGKHIWTDSGSGANHDFSAWRVEVNRFFHEAEGGLFAVNSFVGASSTSRPSSSPVANTLRLPLPSRVVGKAEKPELTSREKPPEHTNPVVERIVTVPFTAVDDRNRPFAWIVENSPFYDIERSVCYDLVMFDDNTTDHMQRKSRTVTTGITKEQSETFSKITGVSVSYATGVEAGGFSTKASVQMSLQLGYSTTTSVAVFRSEQEQAVLSTPPRRAAAMWIEANTIQVIRSDDTAVAPELEFDAGSMSFVEAQYPPPAPGSPRVEAHLIPQGPGEDVLQQGAV